MNPPAKPSLLHVIAVFAGLIMLFTGTWMLVKKSSPNPDAVSEKATAAQTPAATGKPAEKADAKQPEATAPATTVTSSAPSAPELPASAVPAPAPAPEISMRLPEVADAPAVPAAVPLPSPDPAPTAFPLPGSMAMVPGPEANPAPPVPEPSPPPLDMLSFSNADITGPFEIHGPLPPELQPSVTSIAANIDPNAAPFPPATEEPIPMPAASGKPPLDTTQVAPGSELAMAAANAPGGIKDVTNSKAGHHDMEESEPEDGPVHPPSGKVEKTTDIKPTTSTSMPGWEMLNYQSRDYITANSIHRFYRFTHLKVDGKNVWFTSPVLIMKATLGSPELLINNIKFVMSYPVIELNGKPCISRLDLCKLVDPVLRPSYIGTSKPFDTVVIDPGHGGSDGGARGIYGHEKDFALKLGLLLKRALEQRGLKVVMTRSTDVFISLPGRVAIANKTPNSIYVSLHYNSGGSAATGIETFALSPQGSSSIYGQRSVDALAFQGNQLDSENIALATAVHAGVVHHFKFVDRGVKRARWRVLTTLQRPGILFEGGFVTNANDGRIIAADNYRQEMANTIAQSLINYRNALTPRGRGQTTQSQSR